MKKFVFSMEKILSLRRFEQQAAESELAKVIAEINRIQNELDEAARKKAGTIKVSDANDDFYFKSSAQNYIFFLDQKVNSLQEEMVRQQILAEEKRKVVRKAIQKVKVLEKLNEKEFKEWKKAVETEEENDNDDLNIARKFSDSL